MTKLMLSTMVAADGKVWRKSAAAYRVGCDAAGRRWRRSSRRPVPGHGWAR